MDIAKYLTSDEKTAIATLLAGGFLAFTDARLGDVRELDTGLRRRTFRNRGKHQLVLACRNLADRLVTAGGCPAVADEPRKAVKTIDDLQRVFPDLCREMVDRVVPGGTIITGDPADPEAISVPVALKPVGEMTKAELLTEARGYPDITGENAMNKPELVAVVTAHRDRRSLINRDFGGIVR